MSDQTLSNHNRLYSQREYLHTSLASLKTASTQEMIEQVLSKTFARAPENILPNSETYYALVNYHLYRFIIKHYQHQEERVCFWRFIKDLSYDQLNYTRESNPEIKMLDALIRVYYYSEPLDDLTCIFVPINDDTLISEYLEWIKGYFYDANFPTSLLWLYALDSSLASLFPNEILYFGQRKSGETESMMIPDFSYKDAVLIKRFSTDPRHYFLLEHNQANYEFQQIFNFLQQEFQDRCLSRSVKQDQTLDRVSYNQEWEKFENVLRFGVSDQNESGCISFSDMRASTEFLTTYGKSVFLNKIQQPFFERTKLINKRYKGRIDKFMGDNVMCVFLSNTMKSSRPEEKEEEAIVSTFLALFDLNKVLFELLTEKGFADSRLGLRSGTTYGTQILRSNLGNEIVRDFTVTGDTVNLASRLEHISISELIIQNDKYFENARKRFPQIVELLSCDGNFENLNPETKVVIRQYTLYQNIFSNLEKLEHIKFDIRLNHNFYLKLKAYFKKIHYELLNPDTAEIYGYEEYNLEGLYLRFYFSYYNPKGFRQYEKIWLLPLDEESLRKVNLQEILYRR